MKYLFIILLFVSLGVQAQMGFKLDKPTKQKEPYLVWYPVNCKETPNACGCETGKSEIRFVNSKGSSGGETNNYMWDITLKQNDILSWRIQNISYARAITITDFKIYIEKTPQ